MCNHQAIAKIALKAIQAGRWADDQIRDALVELADEGRTVTTDTLRVQLDGPPDQGRREVAPW